MNFKVIAFGFISTVFLASCGSGETTTATTDTTPVVETPVEVQTVKVAESYNVNIAESNIAWLGKKVGGQHNGDIKLTSGSLELTDGELTGGEFVVDMTSITCLDLKPEDGNEKLVGHLKADDFFGVEAYPTATLKIKKVEGENTTADLTIRDKTNEITFPTTLAVDEAGNVTGTAKLTFDRSKFDVKYNSKNFFEDLVADKIIDDNIELSIEVKAAK